MNGSEGADIAIFVICVFLFLGYHAWLFYVRAKIPEKYHRKSSFNVWSSNKLARAYWAHTVAMDDRDALQTYGVQNLRNAITASSFLATTCALIAVQGILRALLDPTYTAQLDKYAAQDPITGGHSWLGSSTKLGIVMAMSFLSFLCFTQSIRLMVHMGFYLKCIPNELNEHQYFSSGEVTGMSMRASLFFTLGLRSFYAFIPLLMWILGATWLLVITILEVIMLIFTDSIPRKDIPHLHGDSDADPEQGCSTTGSKSNQGRRRRDKFLEQRTPENGVLPAKNDPPELLGD